MCEDQVMKKIMVNVFELVHFFCYRFNFHQIWIIQKNDVYIALFLGIGYLFLQPSALELLEAESKPHQTLPQKTNKIQTLHF